MLCNCPTKAGVEDKITISTADQTSDVRINPEILIPSILYALSHTRSD